MKVFAHRGFSGWYPENTMFAFEKAVEAGAYGIELDVHKSRDGKLVVIHDESLKRTTGCDGVVSDYDLSELESINAGYTALGKNGKDRFGETPIPSLETYCRFIRDKNIVTNIEIKTNNTYYPGIEEDVVEMVAEYGLDDKIIFSSFNWLSLNRIKKLAPHIPAGVLIEDRMLRHIAPLVAASGLQFLHPGFDILDEECVAECNAAGIGLNVWTVNTDEKFTKLLNLKIEGVITNYPDLCLNNFGKQG